MHTAAQAAAAAESALVVRATSSAGSHSGLKNLDKNEQVANEVGTHIKIVLLGGRAAGTGEASRAAGQGPALGASAAARAPAEYRRSTRHAVRQCMPARLPCPHTPPAPSVAASGVGRAPAAATEPAAGRWRALAAAWKPLTGPSGRRRRSRQPPRSAARPRPPQSCAWRRRRTPCWPRPAAPPGWQTRPRLRCGVGGWRGGGGRGVGGHHREREEGSGSCHCGMLACYTWPLRQHPPEFLAASVYDSLLAEDWKSRTQPPLQQLGGPAGGRTCGCRCMCDSHVASLHAPTRAPTSTPSDAPNGCMPCTTPPPPPLRSDGPHAAKPTGKAGQSAPRKDPECPPKHT